MNRRPVKIDDPLHRVAVTTARLDDRVSHLESLEIPRSGFRLLAVVYLYAAGQVFSYSPDPRATALLVEGVGGGGGGGGCGASGSGGAAGGGGGGGGYAAVWVPGPLKETYKVQVGPGAPQQQSSGAFPGLTGTDTIFDQDDTKMLIARGGEGGVEDTRAGAHIGGEGGLGGGMPGATASNNVGEFIIPGRPGQAGIVVAAAQAVSGAGGHSVWGTGGRQRVGQGPGNNPSGYGSAGSGGCIVSSGSATVGRGGKDGLMRIWEYTDDII